MIKQNSKMPADSHRPKSSEKQLIHTIVIRVKRNRNINRYFGG